MHQNANFLQETQACKLLFILQAMQGIRGMSRWQKHVQALHCERFWSNILSPQVTLTPSGERLAAVLDPISHSV